MIKKWLFTFTLKKLLTRPCDTRISRNGESGKKIDCFAIYINRHNSPYLQVDGIYQDRVEAREWDGNQFGLHINTPIADILNDDLYVIHYKGLKEIRTKGLWRYALRGLYYIDPILLLIDKITNAIIVPFLSLRRRSTKRRYKFLKYLVTQYFEDNAEFSHFIVAMDLYGPAVFNTANEGRVSQIAAQLHALVETDELEYNSQSGRFKVKGLAWKALSEYEETDRRQTTATIIQMALISLSIVIAIFTAAQANFIKLPTKWDFRSAEEIKKETPLYIVKISHICMPDEKPIDLSLERKTICEYK